MLPRKFFQTDPLVCASELIGTTLNWGRCAGVIVETEAYLEEGDEASHAFSRPSARSFIQRNKPGACYIYFNYGVHWMLNVLVKGGIEKRIDSDSRARTETRNKFNESATRFG